MIDRRWSFTQSITHPATPTVCTPSIPAGGNTLFGDGSVRFMLEEMDPFIWVALSTRNLNEVISNAGG